MAKLKYQQVMRTRVPLKKGGYSIKPGTRVVVTSEQEDGVRVRVDALNEASNVQGLKFTTSHGALKQTYRGRPKAA